MRLLALALGLAIAVTAHAGGDGPAGSNPGDSGAALPGMGLSAEAMLFTGSATARFAFEVPAGRNNVQPMLEMVYVGENGAGSWGLGWEIPLGRIERSTAWGVPSYDATDHFVVVLPGGAVELVSLGGSAYAARVDTPHFYVTYNAAQNSWTLRDRGGRRYTFGDVAAARTGQNGAAALADTFAWHLNRVADLNDNAITITYTQGTGVTRPTAIDYTGHGTTAGPYNVNLQWQPASAYKVSYDAGFRQQFDQQLEAVEVWGGATRLRTYDLVWAPQSGSGFPELQEIQLQGKGTAYLLKRDGTTRAAQKFAYNDLPVSSGSLTYFASSLSNEDVKGQGFRDDDSCNNREFVDLNGDSLPDLVTVGSWGSNGGYWSVYFNRGRDAGGYFTTATLWKAPVGCISKFHVADPNGDTSSYTISTVMDLNGDGYPDYLNSNGSTLNVFWNTGTGFATTGQDSLLGGWVRMTVRVAGRENESGTIYDLTDLNGDGLPDRVWNGLDDPTLDWKDTGKWRVRFNQGGVFPAGVGVPSPRQFVRYSDLLNGDDNQPISTEDLFDINGDGLADKIVANGTDWRVWFGTSSGFQGTGSGGWLWSAPNTGFIRHVTKWRDQFGTDHHRTDFEVLDVTGDGAPDLVDARNWQNNGLWKVYPNVGTGFAATPLNMVAHNFIRDKRIVNNSQQTGALRLDTFDIDGDGYVDTVHVPANTTFAEVWLGHPQRYRVGSLSQTTSAIGGQTRFTYHDIAAVPGVPFPLFVVTQVDRVAPEDPTSAETSTYAYTNPVYYPGYFPTRRPREFRGFGTVTNTMVGKGTEQTFFFQDDARKGKVSRVVTSVSPGAGLLTETTSNWGCALTTGCTAPDDLYGRYFPTLNDTTHTDHGNVGTDDRVWDGNGATKAVTTTFQYDPCGNITLQRGTDAATGAQVESSATFAPIGGGCDASRRVCLGVCDRPDVTKVKGALYEGGPAVDVMVKKHHYDGVGNPDWMQMTGPGSPKIEYTYDTYGNVLTRKDPNGFIATSTYDADNLYVTSVTNNGNNTAVTTAYDTALGGRLKKKVDENKFANELAYDDFLRLEKMWEHDDVAQPTLGTSAAEPSKKFVYTIGYDAQGRGQQVDAQKLVVIEGGLGGGTRYMTTSSYSDSLGRPRQTQATGEVRGVDQTVVTGATRYGTGGLVTGVHKLYLAGAAPPTTFIDIPVNPDVPTADVQTTTEYDPFGRPVVITRPDGAVTRMSRRVARVERTCDPMHEAVAGGSIGECTETEKDAFKRRIAQRTYFGSTLYAWQDNVFSGAGWLLSARKNGDNATKIKRVYDALGRKTQTTDPDSGIWRYGYDTVGNLTFVDDPASNQHIQTHYDLLSRVTTRDAFIGGDTTNGGTLKTVASFTYDTAPGGKGRVATASDWTWDRDANEVGHSVTTYERYDARGNTLSTLREITFGGATKRFRSSSSYNAKAGRVQRTTFPYNDTGSETMHYHYTRAGLLAGMASLVGTYVTDVQRDEFGRVVKVVYGNGVEDTTTYRDPSGLGVLDSQRQLGAGGTIEETITRKPADPLLRDVWYELYDVTGNVQAVQDLVPNLPNTVVTAPWNHNTVASYDDGDRLTSTQQCSAGGYNGTYDTDAQGRVQDKDGLQYFYGDAAKPHQLTRVRNPNTGVSDDIRYDGNGSMTQLSNGRRAEYDALGRLIRVEKAGSEVARYAYDSAGSRIASWTPSDGVTYFFGGFDIHGRRVYRNFRLGDQLIATHDVPATTAMFAAATPAADRFFALARGVLLVVGIVGIPLVLPRRRRLRRGVAGMLAILIFDATLPQPAVAWDCAGLCCDEIVGGVPPPAGTVFYHTDRLGTPELLTDATGQALEYLTHRPWGTLAGSYDADGVKRSASRSPFLFSGQRADATTGLVYFGARYYDPDLGVFISHDPARQFTSPYSYTGGDPLNATDPDGTFIWLIPIILAVLAAVAASVDAYVKTGDIGVAAKAGALSSASSAAGPLSPVLQAVAPKEFGEFDAGDWAISQVPVAGSAYGAAKNFDNGNYASGAVGVIAAAYQAYGVYSSGDWSSPTAALTSVGKAATAPFIGDNFGQAWRTGISDTLAGNWRQLTNSSGYFPSSWADAIEAIPYPDNAKLNGMHSWHGGTNAWFARSLGVLGAPIVLGAGVIHESPLDWNSFKGEFKWQGAVNQVLDSSMDIVANLFGATVGHSMLMRNVATDQLVVDVAMVANYFPGPSDPDPAFGGHGAYRGNPSDEWGPYP